MQSKEYVRLALPDSLTPDCVGGGWTVEVHPRESAVLTFWDTFEWGVWFGGHVLYQSGKEYRLCSRSDVWLGAVVAQERGTAGRRFWQEFDTEPMRGSLQAMLGLRGLALVADGILHRQLWDLRNETGKIVCRLECSEVSSGRRGEPVVLHSCQVMPLTGYQAEAASVVERLTDAGAVPADEGPLEALLREAGRQPRPYTLRPLFGLEFGTSAREAVGGIVTTILAIADSNVPGIIEDIDTEFLHDYRICLRKVRSVLALVKDVYPTEETRTARRVLGDLARQTNRLRDLDVYLLAKDEYLGLLPPRLRPALGRMFDDFASHRSKEARRTAARLQSSITRKALQETAALFSRGTVHGPAPAADLPVGPLVFRRIYRTYRKIRTIGQSIGKDTPDEMVHRLRIECKKLRYLLEFFGELIPEKLNLPLVKSLRRLQNWLGEFNDASVQQQSLLEYWDRKGGGAEVALGLGGLVSLLYERQQRTRSNILAALDEFCGDATCAAFRRTFKLPASLPEPDDNEGPQS